MLSDLEQEMMAAIAEKARRRSRTTYEDLAREVGWSHRNGRGLGKHLFEIMRECKECGIPPLTLIVVQKGSRFPAPDALPHIYSFLGSVDIAQAQQDVFKFDWNTVPELGRVHTPLPDGRDVWITSFWYFNPETWGCLGFSEPWRRNLFLRRSGPGRIVAIYITKHIGPEGERGKVVGFLEISNTQGETSQFVSGGEWVAKEADHASKGKWRYALKVTRAWRIAPEDQKLVDELLPKTYSSNNAEHIGAQGVPVDGSEIERLLKLTVYEVPVYGQHGKIDSAVESFQDALGATNAVPPAKEPYWVGETDGPKHLYILRLTGDSAAYLGKPAAELEEKLIIKVGFSKSPLSRRDQIQSAYPIGAYKWEVMYPTEIPQDPPYPNAETAIVGEDAIKARLVQDQAEWLGGEFYLADPGLVYRAWIAGTVAAAEKSKEMETKRSRRAA